MDWESWTAWTAGYDMNMTVRNSEWYAAPGGLLTKNAIHRVLDAIWSQQFDVRLIHGDPTLHPPRLKMWRARELTHEQTVKWLRAKNAHGYNIFFRPNSYDFVLVDDVCADALNAMRHDGIRTSAEIETSKGNFQAWIRIGDRSYPADHDAAMRAARHLASSYGGDMRSAKAEQLGRLPGFRNRKQKHQDATGHYPLVLVRRAVFTGVQTVVIEPALSTPLPPSPRSARALDITESGILDAPIADEEARELWEEARAELELKFGALPFQDRNATDFRVARHFAISGIEPEITAKIIYLNSRKAQEREFEYVRLTIKAAYADGD